MLKSDQKIQALENEIAELKAQLTESQETLRAIQSGEVDALVVQNPAGDQIYTLKDAEHPYRVMVESMTEGAATISADGTIFYCNHQLASLLKVPLNRIMGTSIFDFIAPRRRTSFRAALRQAKSGTGKAEIDIRTLEGDIIPVLISARPLSGDNKRMISLIITDLSIHKHAEQIMASEKFARILLDQAADALLVCDSDGIVIRASDKAHQLIGSDLEGWRFDQIFSRFSLVSVSGHPDPSDLAGQPICFSSLCLEKISSGSEVALKGRVEQTFVINFSPLSEDGDFLGYSISLIDISQLKQAQDLLKIRNERLRILSEANSLLLSSDTPTKIVQTIAERVMVHLGCDFFFNYVVDEKAGKLRLNAYYGIPKSVAKGIEWLNYGEAICGCTARDGASIISENVQTNGDPRAALVRSFGVQVYAANPLKIGSQTIGTLSFGNSHRTYFTPDELDLMKTIATQISIAMERKQIEEELAHHKDELEIRVRERTQELQQANEQLKQYSRRITQVQEEERKRIAYELHDDTAQYLAILKLQLDSILHSGKIQAPEIVDKLQYLEKDASRAVDDVRRYSHELRPTVLEHMGLQAALEQIAEDLNKLKQMEVSINVDGDEPEVTEEVKLGFFRIAQEALNNARKHARASQAVIDLKFEKQCLSMEVRDNGVGFDVERAAIRSNLKGSLGLTSMQERAKLIGADLRIESQPGKGTAVKAEMPL